MDCLNFILGRVLDKTATKAETDIFIKHVNEALSRGWEEWKLKNDSMTVEEDCADFIRRMKEQGCEGDSYEDAMAFLDKEFPNNVRRLNLEKRKKRQL